MTTTYEAPYALAVTIGDRDIPSAWNATAYAAALRAQIELAYPQGYAAITTRFGATPTAYQAWRQKDGATDGAARELESVARDMAEILTAAVAADPGAFPCIIPPPPRLTMAG